MKALMRLVAVCMMMLCGANAAQAQLPSVIKKMNLERERFKAAKIDTVIVMEYGYKGTTPEKKGRQDMILAYNTNGNITLEGRCDAKGGIDTKVTYSYNNKNAVSEIKSYMQFETLSYTLKHSYNGANLLTEAVYDDNMSKGSGRKQVYSYKKERLAECKYVNANATIGYRDVYSYNDKGDCIKSIRYRADNSIDNKEEMKYDAQGNLAEVTRFTGMEMDESSAKIERKTTYKYDAQGNVVEEMVLNAKGKPESKLVHSYDARGILTQTVVWSSKKGTAPTPSLLRKYVVQVVRS